MNKWLVIPVTKMELTKAIFWISFIVPPAVVLYIGTWDVIIVLIFWIFPLMFLWIFKDEFGWDFHIKIKFFEGKQT